MVWSQPMKMLAQQLGIPIVAERQAPRPNSRSRGWLLGEAAKAKQSRKLNRAKI
jgi:hypothetical protein